MTLWKNNKVENTLKAPRVARNLPLFRNPLKYRSLPVNIIQYLVFQRNSTFWPCRRLEKLAPCCLSFSANAFNYLTHVPPHSLLTQEDSLTRKTHSRKGSLTRTHPFISHESSPRRRRCAVTLGLRCPVICILLSCCNVVGRLSCFFSSCAFSACVCLCVLWCVCVCLKLFGRVGGSGVGLKTVLVATATAQLARSRTAGVHTFDTSFHDCFFFFCFCRKMYVVVLQLGLLLATVVGAALGGHEIEARAQGAVMVRPLHQSYSE